MPKAKSTSLAVADKGPRAVAKWSAPGGEVVNSLVAVWDTGLSAFNAPTLPVPKEALADYCREGRELLFRPATIDQIGAVIGILQSRIKRPGPDVIPDITKHLAGMAEALAEEGYSAAVLERAARVAVRECEWMPATATFIKLCRDEVARAEGGLLLLEEPTASETRYAITFLNRTPEQAISELKKARRDRLQWEKMEAEMMERARQGKLAEPRPEPEHEAPRQDEPERWPAGSDIPDWIPACDRFKRIYGAGLSRLPDIMPFWVAWKSLPKQEQRRVEVEEDAIFELIDKLPAGDAERVRRLLNYWEETDACDAEFGKVERDDEER